MMTSAPRPKPKLRGIFHLAGALVVLPIGITFSGSVEPTLQRAVTLYCLSLFLLLSVSAIYHVPMWAPAPRAKLRRLDHAMIYILIGGSYLPYLSTLESALPSWLEPAVIVSTVLGVAKSLLWTGKSRLLRSLPFLFFGFAGVLMVPALYHRYGVSPVALLLGGGMLYAVGVLFYVLKRPDPWPRYFGYHELFHLCVNGAAACHFISIWQATEGYRLFLAS